MFVGRRSDGTIYGCWTVKQPNDNDHPLMEELPDNHPDVVDFLAPKPVIPDPIDGLRAALIADPTLLNKLKAVK